MRIPNTKYQISKISKFMFLFLLTFITLYNFALAQTNKNNAYIVFSRFTSLEIERPKDDLSLTGEANGYWQIWLLEPDGKDQRQLTTSPEDKRNPTVSLDGKTLVYRTHNSQLFALDLETNTSTQILKKMGNIVDPIFSPKSNSLVFSRNKPDARCDSDLWQASPDGKAIKKLTQHICVEYHPQFSLQEDLLVFVLQDESGSKTEPQIGLLDLEKEGKVTYLLTRQGSNLRPCISANGKTIVFSSNRTGNYEIWSIDTKGKKLTQLTHHQGFDSHPVFSPHSTFIVFVSDRSGTLQLWKMDRQGNNLKQLTFGPQASIEPAFAVINFEVQ